jgi:hypothetical protein
MTTPTLVVVGDKDDTPRQHGLTVRGPDWRTEPYTLSPGEKSLLTLFGAEHSLGGIASYDVKETTDDSPARVALIQRVTWACLRHALGLDESASQALEKALTGGGNPLGRLESKR